MYNKCVWMCVWVCERENPMQGINYLVSWLGLYLYLCDTVQQPSTMKQAEAVAERGTGIRISTKVFRRGIPDFAARLSLSPRASPNVLQPSVPKRLCCSVGGDKALLNRDIKSRTENGSHLLFTSLAER
jgi:hypothetical protein